MGILNVTPDSFSDGGEFFSVDAALTHAEQIIADGADIIDIGGESTRPGSRSVTAEEESARTVPVIEAIAKRFDTPISIDTGKSAVARRAVDRGAEIINDISGLRFDERLAAVAASVNAGLVLMHSLGTFETLHTAPPVRDILIEVETDLKRALAAAYTFGVKRECIALDIGIGFGKTFAQNLELIAKLDSIVQAFAEYPMAVGVSRKSFIAKATGGKPAKERLGGSLIAALIAIQNGAKIIRVHDVKETVAAINEL